MEIREDSIEVKAKYTDEGYLIDEPILTKVGIFEYVKDGKTRRELRIPEEVFAQESLDSYEGKPIIVTHNAGLITTDNVKREEVGTILSKGIKDNDNVRAKIVIHDTKSLDTGLRELSLGYELDIEEKSGEYEGQHYDAIQRNIRINHLALVKNARAGNTARLNIDSADETSNEEPKGETKAMEENPTLSPEQLADAIKMYLEAEKNKKGEEQQDTKCGDSENEEIEEKSVDSEEEEETEEKDPIDEIRERYKDDDSEYGKDIKECLKRIDEIGATNEYLTSGDEEGQGTAKEVFGEDPSKPIPMNEEEEKKKVNADSSDYISSDVVDLIRTADKLGVKIDGKANKTALKKAVVKKIKPTMNMDGKNDNITDVIYELALADYKATKQEPKTNKSAMYNADSKDIANKANISNTSATDARQRMIARQRGEK